MVISRFEIYLVHLDPTQGVEIQKTRPCAVVSPDVMNRNLNTVIVAPMTTRIRGYPSRVRVNFRGRAGEIALDQLRSVDKQRLVRRLGKLDSSTSDEVLEVLSLIFAR